MPPHITRSSLSPPPQCSSPDFPSTSLFQRSPSAQLPSPQHVLDHASASRSGVVKFEDLGQLVKFSPDIKFEAVQAMQAIRAAFPQEEIVIPEGSSAGGSMHSGALLTSV